MNLNLDLHKKMHFYLDFYSKPGIDLFESLLTFHFRLYGAWIDILLENDHKCYYSLILHQKILSHDDHLHQLVVIMLYYNKFLK
jgi:hypothetical protein